MEKHDRTSYKSSSFSESSRGILKVKNKKEERREIFWSEVRSNAYTNEQVLNKDHTSMYCLYGGTNYFIEIARGEGGQIGQ